MIDYPPLAVECGQTGASYIDKLTEVGEAIGGWSDKVVATTMAWVVNLLPQCPAKLADACRRLLAADEAAAAALAVLAVAE